MDNLIFNDVTRYFIFSLAILSGVVTMVYPFFRKKSKADLSVVGSKDEIDYEKLEKAEEAVKDMDLLKSLYERYAHVESFPTLKGYDDSVMTKIIVALKEKGIACDYYFSQSMPAGYASITTALGEYLLFVDPEKVDEAKTVLNEHFKD